MSKTHLTHRVQYKRAGDNLYLARSVCLTHPMPNLLHWRRQCSSTWIQMETNKHGYFGYSGYESTATVIKPVAIQLMYVRLVKQYDCPPALLLHC